MRRVTEKRSSLAREHAIAGARDSAVDACFMDPVYTGGTLFVDHFGTLIALRRNAQQKPTRERYAPRLPPGFEAARKKSEGNFVVATRGRGEPGLIGWYLARKNSAVEIIALAHDASEFDGVREPTSSGRRMMLVTQVRDGCDPHDGYIGFIERDGLLYEIVIEVAPNTPRRSVEPLERAFFDEPFGIDPKSPGTSLGFKLPPAPVMPGPC